MFVGRCCATGLKWEPNGLRHRVSPIDLLLHDTEQVAVGAENSPEVIFADYRELITQDKAKSWFDVKTRIGIHATTEGIRGIADPTGNVTASPSTTCTCLAYIAHRDDSPGLVPPFRSRRKRDSQLSFVYQPSMSGCRKFSLFGIRRA